MKDVLKLKPLSKASMFRDIPKNPYRSEGITDKEFKEAVIEDRQFRQKKFGRWTIMR